MSIRKDLSVRKDVVRLRGLQRENTSQKGVELRPEAILSGIQGKVRFRAGAFDNGSAL